MTVTYLGSYTDTESYRTTDLDVTSEVGFDLYRPELTEFMTHELRVTSNNEGSLEWIVGAFNSKKGNDWEFLCQFLRCHQCPDRGRRSGQVAQSCPPGHWQSWIQCWGICPCRQPLAQEQGVRIYFPFENRYREIEHIGAFVSVNYTLLEHWELGLGLRADYWTSDTLDRNAGYTAPGFRTSTRVIRNFCPKFRFPILLITVTWLTLPLPRVMRPGGYNLYDPFGTPLLNAFSEEEASSYELGLKTSLLDGTLAVNMAGILY